MMKFNEILFLIGVYQIIFGFLGFIINDVSTNEELMVGGLFLIVLALLFTIIRMIAFENESETEKQND